MSSHHTPPALRDYQQKGIDDIRAAFLAGHRRVCYTLPTGGGKTHTFAWLTKRSAGKGKRVCILVHREELIDQVSDALTAHGCHHGIIKAGRPADILAPVQIASVFTLRHRMQLYPHFDVIIEDECHHAPAGSWAAPREFYSEALILGVTATPCRMDGKGLANSFDHLVVGPTVKQLTDAGYLVPALIKCPSVVDLTGVKTTAGDFNKQQLAMAMDTTTIYGDVIKNWRRFADGLPTVAFCASVANAEKTAEEFNAAGIPAISIDGKLDPAERKRRINELREGRIFILTSCDLISEGFDLPGIHAAILLRPTKSLSLHLQQVGRVLRPAPGKTQAIILDHVGNSSRHGAPDQDREWELTKDKMKSAVAPLRTCADCYAMFPAGHKRCPVCGIELSAFQTGAERGNHKVKKDVELVDFNPEEHMWRRLSYNQALKRIKTMHDLRTFAKARGYKHGFVWHKSKELGLRK